MCLNDPNITIEKQIKYFPVLLEKYDFRWKEYYSLGKKFLQNVFEDKIIRINHIGSRSVEGLLAKPIIDILLEISEGIDLTDITEKLGNHGYSVLPEEFNPPEFDKIIYVKGCTPHTIEDIAVFIHVRNGGDWDELYFRDYLIEHSDKAREYARLKQELKNNYADDMVTYTKAKGPFIQECIGKARKDFPNRYNQNQTCK